MRINILVQCKELNTANNNLREARDENFRPFPLEFISCFFP